MLEPAAVPEPVPLFLSGGGEMGAALRAHDWAATPLGPAERWPEALRVLVGVILGSAQPMFICWGAERIMLYNDGYAPMLGRRHPDALGRPFEQVWYDILDDVLPILDRAYAGEGTQMEDIALLMHRHGYPEETHFAFSYTPVRGASGAVEGMFCACRETTEQVVAQRSRASEVERLRAEWRLRESEDRFRQIADLAPVPIWVSKLDRTRGFVNQAYVDFIGVDRDAARTFDWREILHPRDHDRIVAESIAGEASLKPFILEARYRRGDGEWRWVRSTSAPRWGPDGELAGFIGVAHDVTEAKKAEKALRELNETLERHVEERTADLKSALGRLQEEVADRERAEEALRQAQKMEAVGQLTGGIAHDFNNLLTPIIGGLEIIARRLDDPRLRRIAQAALESGQRGAKLATQLLAFSRLQRLAIEPVPINRVIEAMGRILHHTIGPKVEIRNELDPHVGHALCDANQLDNAILNLAINARDAMPDGGALTISTKLHDEPAGPDLAEGRYVCITVADTGHGMAPEILARATEPFFSTKPTGKGTGLGLAQVYAIAQQSGGAVRIESEEGRGTEVHLLLPEAPPKAAAAAEPDADGEAAAPAPAPSADILVVDDDPDVRNFLSHALTELGHRVEACDGGEAAVARLETRTPDLVLIDFAMPGMNGAQLARAIRARDPGQRIAFVTGYAESERIEAAVGGDVPILRKPFTIEALAAIISRPETPAG